MKLGLREQIMWTVFKGGFKRELQNTLNIKNSGAVMKKARKKYKKMLLSAQDPHNRFTANIILASMVGAIYLSLDEKPSVEQMISYTRESVMNNKILLKFIVSEKNYTPRGQRTLAEGAKQSENDNNPYSWQYTYKAGISNMEYTVVFKTCGILHLYKQWNISELTPVMCRLDYDMAHVNHSEFFREQTLAEGGKHCDCHYIHTPPADRK